MVVAAESLCREFVVADLGRAFGGVVYPSRRLTWRGTGAQEAHTGAGVLKSTSVAAFKERT